MDNIIDLGKIENLKRSKKHHALNNNFFLVISFFGSVGTIGAGERGVLLQFGAVKDKVFDEGLYFKIPFIQQVVKMDVKIAKRRSPGQCVIQGFTGCNL